MRNFLRNAIALFSLLFACACPSFASVMATATYSASQTSPGTYNYALTLNNTGTTDIGTFWFSWVPGAGFLSPIPVAGSITSPTGWSFTATNAGAGIRWVTTGSLLASGSSLSGFSFSSTETPSQLAATSTVNNQTYPGSVFYVYEGTPLNTPAFQSVATSVTPEPGSLLLTLTGMSGVLLAAKRKLFA